MYISRIKTPGIFLYQINHQHMFFVGKEHAEISLPYNKIGLIVWSNMCILVFILGFKVIILRFNEYKALADLTQSCFFAWVKVPEAEHNIPRYLLVVVQDIVLLKHIYDCELMS